MRHPAQHGRTELGTLRLAIACIVALAALVALGVLAPTAAQATTFPLRPELLQPVLGEPSRATVAEGDTLLDIAAEHGLGYEQVILVNPDVDVWIPDAGTEVVLPTWMVLPMVERRGLVINIPEMRLYDFTQGPEPIVLAVAVGDIDDPTPIGEFTVGRKRVDPVWHVPESIQAERPGMPTAVPPGPDNPLGDRWMTIGNTTYGIHGTNNQWSIGQEATHGCVRLYNRDMHALFDRTPTGTPIRLIYEPVKLGRLGNEIVVEVHPDLYKIGKDPLPSMLVRLLALGLEPYVDRDRLRDALAHPLGIPVAIGALPAGTPGVEPGAEPGPGEEVPSRAAVPGAEPEVASPAAAPGAVPPESREESVGGSAAGPASSVDRRTGPDRGPARRDSSAALRERPASTSLRPS